jgi:hypothetical protein
MTANVVCQTVCTFVLEIGAWTCRFICVPPTKTVNEVLRKKCYEEWLRCMSECKKKPKCDGAS